MNDQVASEVDRMRHDPIEQDEPAGDLSPAEGIFRGLVLSVVIWCALAALGYMAWEGWQ